MVNRRKGESKLDPHLKELTSIYNGSRRSIRIIMAKFGVSESQTYAHLTKKKIRLPRIDRPWTSEENERLVDYLSRYDEVTTAQKMKRTKPSIRSQIRRLHLTALQVRSEWYTGTEAAYILGISLGTLKTRIESGALVAKRNNNIDQPNCKWFITKKSLTEYIIKYPLELEGKKFDATIVVDLLVNRQKDKNEAN